MAENKPKKLGQQLLEAGVIDEEQLEDALTEQEQVDRRLGNILIDRGWITEDKLVEFLSKRTGYPVVELRNYPIQEDALETIPRKQAEHYRVLPLIRDSNTLTIAMQDPIDLPAIDDIAQLTGLDIEPMIAPASKLEKYIKKAYDGKGKEDDDRPEIEVVGTGELYRQDLGSEEEEIRERPAVRMVNQIIRDALERGASNIHVDPKQNSVDINLRVDGFVRQYTTLPHRMHSQILTRFQVMAESSEETESEFGGYKIIRLEYGEEPVTIRMNTIDTRFGEKLMVKVCRGEDYQKDITELGMDMSALTVLEDILSAPRGLILYTGPDDSGKTTSLYSSLQYLSDSPNSIITVEDPIEAELDFCTQLEVPVGKPEAKAAEIYNALRADPDILMVSEMGEPEVARATLYAAATGRKVLSSYYADNSVDALYHLANSDGVDPYQLANSVVGVVSQRLVRLVDEEEAEVYNPPEGDLERLGLPKDAQYYRSEDGKGYDGVTGIFQVLPVTDELRLCILDGETYSSYQESVQKIGLPTLREKGIQKVKSGSTTIEEVLRVTFREDFTKNLSIANT